MKFLVYLALLLISNVLYADIVGSAYVVDGDTIKINSTRVRLNGIDTPESQQTCNRNNAIWFCGREATDRLRKLTVGKRIHCKGDEIDRYGRLIADCFADAVNLNSAMVESGMALAYRKYSLEYVPEENRARNAKRGLWSGKFVAPWDWRRGKRLKNDVTKEVESTCCKICQKGKACGDSCINKLYSCSKPTGCACNAD